MMSLFELSASSQPVAIAGFAAAFVLGALFFFPRPVMCIAAGVVLGRLAIPVALFASTFGAILAFLLARFAFADWVFRVAHRKRVLQAALKAVDEKSWRLIFLLRLASPVPGTLTSLVFGISRVRLSSYSTATLLGLMPQTILFAELGRAGREAAMVAPGADVRTGIALAGIVILASVTWIVARQARTILRSEYSLVS